MPDFVEIVEVGPRDGLQNETIAVPIEDRISLVDVLSAVGFRRIEVGSFVSPKWVPQMSGSAEVFAGIARVKGVSYAALTPNLKGFEAAVASSADEIAVFASASEGFSRANINASVTESLERFRPVMSEAAKIGLPVRGYVSCVVDCPYDGAVDPSAVADVVSSLFEMGVYEVSLGDTLGHGLPERIGTMLDTVLRSADASKLAGHFHDTDGRALQNTAVALDCGVRVFDAAVGGLGGCPYAPGAPGNVSTTALAEFLAASGYIHGLNMEALAAAEKLALGLRESGR